MNILAISDTHGFHWEINDVPDVDILIHAGDATNHKNTIKNEVEFRSFAQWWGAFPAKHKVYVPGNHDAFATKRHLIDDLKKVSIYLEHENVEIEGVSIFGSPYVPTFGDWYFMKSRNKLSRYWDQIPNETDILITHGPPKGILDLSYNRLRELEFCGDNALLKAVRRVKPKYHIFGHIHDNGDIMNHGMFKREGTTFCNASMVKDGSFEYGISNNPIFFTI